MAQDFAVDPAVERHFIVTDLLCGLIFCDACEREPVYQSQAHDMSDRQRYDQAVAMQAEGWVVLADGIRVLCPECVAARRAI
jgi:hypothetical protein